MKLQKTKYLIFSFLLFFSTFVKAQITDSIPDFKNTEIDTIVNLNSAVLIDSIPSQDSLKISTKKQEPITEIVNYEALDSMLLSMNDKMVYLYGTTKLETAGMSLASGRVEISMEKNELMAQGIVDSLGKEIQKPVFTDNDQTFTAKSIHYNFKTKKGIVKDVITEQGGGYVHGAVTKLQPNKEIHILHGKFTTCNADHPHFYIELTKAIVIPKKRIIAGPFYFVILDIPLFAVGLPYGTFPDQKKHSSGILMPKFDKQNIKGLGLNGLGYYFAGNDYYDLTVLSDLYTSGSWGASVATTFKKRYKFSGSALVQYSKIRLTEKILQQFDDVPTIYQDRQSFKITATYSQDAKANPTSNFSGNVSFDRGGFSKSNAQDIQEYVNSTNITSFSYRKTFRGTPLNLSASANVIQNLADSTTNMKLPSVSLNMARVFPFKRKNASGPSRWYEDIGLTINSSFDNSIDTPDSLLFTKEIFNRMEYGYKYTAPLKTSFNLFKFITVNPSLNYTGRVYPNYINKKIDQSYTDSLVYMIDTVPGIRHNMDFSFSMPFSTKLYGLIEVQNITFKPLKNTLDKLGLIAIRHVLSPSVGYRYKPDFSTEFWKGYAPDPEDSTLYSVYENGIYGYASEGEQQSMTFSVGNIFEMKVKSRKDTTTEFTLIKLLDGLSFYSSYNFAAEEFKLEPLSIKASTTIFNGTAINFNGSIDPYAINDKGERIDTFQFVVNKKLGRFTNGRITVGTSIDSKIISELFNYDVVDKYDDGYSYYKVPWSVRLDYIFSYSKDFNDETKLNESVFSQNVTFSLNLTPTPKWTFALGSGYDFDKRKITSTSINITRDLHCWAMSFNCIPFGTLKSYTFDLGINASIFDVVKYKRENYWQDNIKY